MSYRTAFEERTVTTTKVVEVEITTCNACGEEVETTSSEDRIHRDVLDGWLHISTFTSVSGVPGKSSHYCPTCRKKIDATIQAIKEEI